MDHERKSRWHTIEGDVTDARGSQTSIGYAEIRLYEGTKGQTSAKGAEACAVTKADGEGRFYFDKTLEEGETYQVEASAFGLKSSRETVTSQPLHLKLDLNLTISARHCVGDTEKTETSTHGRVGRRTLLTADSGAKDKGTEYKWHVIGATVS